MIAGLEKIEPFLAYQVDQTMLLGNAARPDPGP